MVLKKHAYLIVSAILLTMFIVFTVLVKTVDVEYIYSGTYLGFHTLNFKVCSWVVQFGKYDQFKTISDVLLYLAIGYSAVLGVCGIIQLIKTKSFKKVNKDFYILLGGYIAVAITYLIFEIAKVNYSPDSTVEELKASYPSSHVFVGCSLYLLNSFTAVKLLNPEKKWISYLIFASTGLICVLTTFTRLMTIKHWLTDIIASVILVAALFTLYLYSYRRINECKESKAESQE